ncbi:MAG TPA: FtsX-like permease family protein, partial [Bryobacteraceae bacterium]|nr:FtsX-like permease family protein [Bryobacteraceae bacterium]
RSARDIPGVRAAALTDALPLGDNFGWRTWDATPSGEEGSEHERKTPLVRLVDDSYFETMQIPLRAGRVFSLEDHASSDAVVIVNEALARSFWPGRDPLGRTLTTNNKPRRVVGVVGGVRYFGLERGSELEMYMPIRHVGDSQVVDLVIRGAIPVTRLAPAVREALRRVDPNLPATEFRTMQQLVDRSVFPRRFVFWLVGAFAAFGLILASLGIYGVMSYSVGQRTQEIGVRMALGASARHLQASILRQTMELAALGLLIGVPASWMTARLIQAHLFGVSSSDRTTFGAVLIILTVVAALAGYVPARRASRLNPLDALRVQ